MTVANNHETQERLSVACRVEDTVGQLPQGAQPNASALQPDADQHGHQCDWPQEPLVGWVDGESFAVGRLVRTDC